MIQDLPGKHRARRSPSRSSSRPCLEPLEPRLAPATLQPGFSEVLLAAGLESPTAMAFAPDGRLFVTEQDGHVRILRDGTLLPTPFLTLSGVDFFEERGLLGLTFDPDFDANHYVYVYYSKRVPGPPGQPVSVFNTVSRFTASGDQAVPGSEVALFSMESGEFHVGGTLQFGFDGKLYVASGDIGDGAFAQRLDNPYGKILRLNPDGTIPSDNPFYNQTTGTNRAIWALGLRNPFKFNLQPGTGRIYVNDVGGDNWEEINELHAGANYGWPYSEGFRLPNDPPTLLGNYQDPLTTYSHQFGCAITGGAFYNPVTGQFPESFRGSYFYSDYCGGWIKSYDPATGLSTEFAADIGAPADLQVGPEGSLYYLAREGGQVQKISYLASPTPPAVTRQPSDQIVSVGYSATFEVLATGSALLTYQWQKNGVDLVGANEARYTTPAITMADEGSQFRCRVSNALGTALSDSAGVTVTTNQPPLATITAPVTGLLFNAGGVINFAGTAMDPEAGPLGASAFQWRVSYFTGSVERPHVPPTLGVTSGSFTAPGVHPYLQPDVFFRIYLTVTDSVGLTTTVHQDVLPNTVRITLASNVPTLRLLLDGQSVITPHSFTAVVGLRRTIGVVTPQVSGDITFNFVSWSDGGAPVHTFNTPSSNTTYTANFESSLPTLHVMGFTSTSTGFIIDLNGPIDLSVLNLYDPSNPSMGPADVTVVGMATGPVRGSLVVNPLGSQITFIATGGVLPDDTYEVRLRSAANGFKELTDGEWLDGDGDAVPGGDFVRSWDVVAQPGLAVSIPNFMRGPGQTVAVPAGGTGLPLRLSSSLGVTSVLVTLRYNPALLTISAASVAPGLPTDATVTLDTSTPGSAVVSFTSSALDKGITDFVYLTATVPISAAPFYRQKQILDLADLQVNGGRIPSLDDDGIHLIGYLGDVTGNGDYSGLDVSRVMRLANQTLSGFAAYPLADPLLSADVTGNGEVTTTDATRIAQEIVGLDPIEIPALPPSRPTFPVSGRDPLLHFGSVRTQPGARITVPLLLDDSDDLQAGDFAISFDPSRLELLSLADVQRGSLTQDFDLFVVRVDAKAGTIRVTMGRSAAPINGRGAGSVLKLTFRVRPNAPAGVTFVNLLQDLTATKTNLNEGGLDLTPDPSNKAGDSLDGVVTVRRRLGSGERLHDRLNSLVQAVLGGTGRRKVSFPARGDFV